ncbi:MAG: hypothetical protein ABJE66_23535 [Deltaproteobacteria bacterium]
MRQARLHTPGIVQHLIWRFVEHRWFIEGDAERTCYLRWLGRALLESDWKCIAFAVMSNHVHLAAIAGNEPLAAWSRRAHLPFAQGINDRLGRIGPVFADRAKCYAIAPPFIASSVAYIHNNPVRAFVVRHARESDWTSHAAYMNRVTPPQWLHVDEGLSLSGHDRDSFDNFVEGHPPAPERPRPEPINRVLQRHGRINTATPFDRQFPLVARAFARVRPNPRRIVELVGASLGLTVEDITSRRRNRWIRAARVAVVHTGLVAGFTGSDIAATLGISQQAVSAIAHRAQRPLGICESVVEQLEKEVRATIML